MFYLPGDSYYGMFTTCDPDTGAATDADSLPTATANKNGTDDSGFTLTVAKVTGKTGVYKVTGTVPSSGYSDGNVVSTYATATVTGTVSGDPITGTVKVDTFRICSAVTSVAPDIDAVDVETGVTLKQTLRAIAAILAGKKAGEGTASVTFKPIGNPSGATRVTGAIDGSGDRTTTLNL